MDKHNGLAQESYRDWFEVNQNGNKITVTRMDGGGARWGMDLKLPCHKVKQVPGPEACMNQELLDDRCEDKKYFPYATRGDGICGCKTRGNYHRLDAEDTDIFIVNKEARGSSGHRLLGTNKDGDERVAEDCY